MYRISCVCTKYNQFIVPCMVVVTWIYHLFSARPRSYFCLLVSGCVLC